MIYLSFVIKSIRGFFYYLFFNPRQLTSYNIKRYFQGNWRLLRLNKLEPHILEQFQYRLTVMNLECLLNKECPCKCEAIGVALADEPCSENCFGWMLEEEVWNNFKRSKDIDMYFISQKAKKILAEY